MLNGDEAPIQTRSSGGGDLILIAAVALLAYRLGKARGAEVRQAPSASAIFAGYFGLRAMDKIFGGMR